MGTKLWTAICCDVGFCISLVFPERTSAGLGHFYCWVCTLHIVQIMLCVFSTWGLLCYTRLLCNIHSDISPECGMMDQNLPPEMRWTLMMLKARVSRWVRHFDLIITLGLIKMISFWGAEARLSGPDTPVRSDNYPHIGQHIESGIIRPGLGSLGTCSLFLCHPMILWHLVTTWGGLGRGRDVGEMRILIKLKI